MPAPVIELENITVLSGERPLFEDASLRLFAGERVLMTAPVASGKNIFLRLISGLAAPEKGAVRVFGEDLSGMAPERLNLLRTRIGFVFKDSILISNLKVLENVALPVLYHTDLSNEETLARALTLLEASGFAGDPWRLPGGLALHEKKEVCVARALSLEPEAVICENLWDGLTEAERARISGLLLKYHGERAGRLLLVTANNESERALIMPDRIVRIEGNRFS